MIANDFSTKSMEVIPLKQVNETRIIYFLEQHLIIRFEYLFVLVFNNASYFPYLNLVEFTLEKDIKLYIQPNIVTIKGMVWLNIPTRILFKFLKML